MSSRVSATRISMSDTVSGCAMAVLPMLSFPACL
jgi:hypothetical protein